MLEEGYLNLHDQALQEGFEIGVSEGVLDSLAEMAGRAKIFLSETKWKRYKKSEENKHRLYMQENPDIKSEIFECHDEAGNLLKEKWVEKQIFLMKCRGFSGECWTDICTFVDKYPNLSSEALARRIIRESEYKYV